MGKGIGLLQKRIEALELRLKSDERGIMAMEGRDAEKFSAGEEAEDLEKHLMELSEATLRQRAIVDNESAERRRLQSEQSSWMQELETHWYRQMQKLATKSQTLYLSLQIECFLSAKTWRKGLSNCTKS